MLENTLENKAKFIAQYWGQKVLTDMVQLHKVSPTFNLCHESFKVQLTPLSKITDEDLINLVGIPEGWEVFKIYNTTIDGYSAVKIRRLYEENELKFNDDGYKYDIKTLSIGLAHISDLLRSKGYALPWMGISVETLVKWGWIVLK